MVFGLENVLDKIQRRTSYLQTQVSYTLLYIRYTLGPKMFGVGDFWLKTRVIIKISTHPCYPRNFDWFSWERSKKKIFLKEVSKMDNSKELKFSKPPILNIFHKIIKDWSLGEKDQLMWRALILLNLCVWSSGCPT